MKLPILALAAILSLLILAGCAEEAAPAPATPMPAAPAAPAVVPTAAPVSDVQPTAPAPAAPAPTVAPPPPTSTPVPTATPARAPSQTAPQPTATAVPTATPAPTATPMPTSTPAPAVGPDWSTSGDAQILGATLTATDSDYLLTITYARPGGADCARAGDHSLKTDANRIHATLPLQTRDGADCDFNTGEGSVEIPLPGPFAPDELTSVLINGKLWGEFTTPRSGFPPPSVNAESPVEQVELLILEIYPPQYQLLVVSGLPMGSGCSMIDGWTIARAAGGEITVRLTHHETRAQAIACTADFPYVETIIPLGADFASGQTYTVRVNQQTTTFTAQ